MDHHAVNDEALDIIFRSARTQNKWQSKDVPDELLRRLVDVLKMGRPAPTARRRASSS